MLEKPNNPVPEPHLGVLFYGGVEVGIEGEDFAILDVVPDLPTQTAARTEGAYALVDNDTLPFEVVLEGFSSLVRLADVVRGRRNHELKLAIRDRIEEVENV